MKWVTLLLVLMLVGLQYSLWFGHRSWGEMLRLEAEVKVQDEANLALEVRNQTLAAEVGDLQDGNEAIAEIARNDLGYVGADEFFYRVLSPNAPASPVVPATAAASAPTNTATAASQP